jgi:hypothetical protein
MKLSQYVGAQFAHIRVPRKGPGETKAATTIQDYSAVFRCRRTRRVTVAMVALSPHRYCHCIGR